MKRSLLWLRKCCKATRVKGFLFAIFLTVLVPLCGFLGRYDHYQSGHLDDGDQGHKVTDEDILLERMKGPPASDDPHLLNFVRERFLLPPSSEPYNLQLSNEEDEEHTGTSLYNMYRATVKSWLFMDKVLKALYKEGEEEEQVPGFFVEAGALDGEYLSNTLDLELRKKWNGLLVEADSDMFAYLVKKNRKAWSSNTCLSVHPYPHQTTLVKFTKPVDPDSGFGLPNRGFTALLESTDLSQRMKQGFPVYEVVQCLPLQTLLLAINVTHVDFFSLDVEGVEMDVLRSFWGSSITVDVWAVEHKHPDVYLGKEDKLHLDFIEWFESKGYTIYTTGSHSPMDYVFIRKGSAIYDRAFSTRPSEFEVH